MRALIVLADNVYLTPYLNFYTNLLDNCNFNYDVIYWDKNNNEIVNKSNYIRFMITSNNKVNRLVGYFKYRKYIKKIEKNKKYDLIIPLHSIVTFIIFDMLLKKYKRRYIYDVRDYSYEKFFVFRYIQKKIVKNSMINIISSDGYREFLPTDTYYVIHNCSNDNYKEFKQIKNSTNETIEISYIGLIRFIEQNQKILLFFKNDKRFHINFIGTNANQLKKFCIDNNINNVTLIDTFDPKLTLNYYQKTDIIMNLYGNHTPLLDYALSNKLYYAANLYKPILVCSDTYMEKISKSYNIGFTLNMELDSEKDKLYDFMKRLDRNEFIKNCNAFMKKVLQEQELLIKELTNRISNLDEKTRRS